MARRVSGLMDGWAALVSGLSNSLSRPSFGSLSERTVGRQRRSANHETHATHGSMDCRDTKKKKKKKTNNTDNTNNANDALTTTKSHCNHDTVAQAFLISMRAAHLTTILRSKQHARHRPVWILCINAAAPSGYIYLSPCTLHVNHLNLRRRSRCPGLPPATSFGPLAGGPRGSAGAAHSPGAGRSGPGASRRCGFCLGGWSRREGESRARGKGSRQVPRQRAESVEETTLTHLRLPARAERRQRCRLIPRRSPLSLDLALWRSACRLEGL